MSIKHLSQKIDRMIAHIDTKLQQQQPQQEEWGLNLFDSEARAAWLAFVAAISDRLTDGARSYDRLNDDELELMEYWATYAQALRDGDFVTAERYRALALKRGGNR